MNIIAPLPKEVTRPTISCPGHKRKFGVREVAVDHVEVSAADRTRRDFDKNLAWTRTRNLALNQPEGAANSLKHQRFHASTSLLPPAFTI